MGMYGLDYSFSSLTEERRATQQARALYESMRHQAEAERKRPQRGDDIVDAEYEVIEPLKLTHEAGE